MTGLVRFLAVWLLVENFSGLSSAQALGGKSVGDSADAIDPEPAKTGYLRFLKAATEREEFFAAIVAEWSRTVIYPKAGHSELRDDPVPARDIEWILPEAFVAFREKTRFRTLLINFTSMQAGGHLSTLETAWNGRNSTSLVHDDGSGGKYGNIYADAPYIDKDHFSTLPIRLFCRALEVVADSGPGDRRGTIVIIDDSNDILRFAATLPDLGVRRTFQCNPNSEFLIGSYHDEPIGGDGAGLHITMEYSFDTLLKRMVPAGWRSEWVRSDGILAVSSAVSDVSISVPMAPDETQFTISFMPGTRVFRESEARMYLVQADGSLLPEGNQAIKPTAPPGTPWRLSLIAANVAVVILFSGMFLWYKRRKSGRLS